MKIVFLGSGEFGIPCLDAVAASGHELSLVVTSPPSPAGRGRKPAPTPVATWARQRGVGLLETDCVNAGDIIERIAEHRPDLLLVIACGQKVGPSLVQMPPKGAINVHASLLPKYRGAAPINWAILNGEEQTGVSIITLAQRIDAGDILGESATPIGPEETAGELHDRLARLAAPLLLETLNAIETGTVAYAPQDDSLATMAPKLSKSNGHLDFSEPAEIVQRRIRGFWPWPGASATYLSGKTGKSCRTVIAAAKVVPALSWAYKIPGVLDEDLNVVCGKDALKIEQIKPSGSPLMDFRSFVNGRQTRPGDVFGGTEA